MIVEVMLYGKSLGTAEWSADKGSSIFQYNSEVINSIEPSPIIMPTEERVFETNRDHINFHNLPYLLADSMPDDFGNAMMKEWLKQRDLSIGDINPVDRLTYVGKRGMGALEYKPANHKENDDYTVDVSELLEVAKKVLEGKQEIAYGDLDKESLTDILRIGTSVGGARAKALIAIKRDQNNKIEEIRAGDIIQANGYSYWLLKIDGANEQRLGEGEGMGKIEFAYYKLAKGAGIEISESTLYEENDRFHFLTNRFDRTSNGEKIHMQTFGALAGIDYKVQKASSYETLFRVMKRLQLPHNQYEQQYRRMLFNVIARNHDDHVKNFSFMMNKDGRWQISPAYDICFSYSPGGTWTNVHQSSINGKYDKFTKDDLLDFAKTFGIKKANNILEEVITAVNQWPKVATEIDIPQEKIQYINKRLRINDFN
ncbi:MAG: type II toxin-antitoxin system HipA family toxin [candidate division Zixibacteria bacterium]|nr:type II toxin-antitoxin system HipA family toxin [candidate division Zixibacteria bacterium]